MCNHSDSSYHYKKKQDFRQVWFANQVNLRQPYKNYNFIRSGRLPQGYDRADGHLLRGGPTLSHCHIFSAVYVDDAVILGVTNIQLI
jgi:hypothetical protein